MRSALPPTDHSIPHTHTHNFEHRFDVEDWRPEECEGSSHAHARQSTSLSHDTLWEKDWDNDKLNQEGSAGHQSAADVTKLREEMRKALEQLASSAAAGAQGQGGAEMQA